MELPFCRAQGEAKCGVFVLFCFLYGSGCMRLNVELFSIAQDEVKCGVFLYGSGCMRINVELFSIGQGEA